MYRSMLCKSILHRKPRLIDSLLEDNPRFASYCEPLIPNTQRNDERLNPEIGPFCQYVFNLFMLCYMD